MDKIQEVIKKIAELTSKGVVYPPELLSKHNLSIPKDKEHYEYLTKGGAAGGYLHWLTLLTKYSNAKTIVELGNRYGSSTIAIFHGLKKNQKFLTVDMEKDQRYVPEKIFKDPRVKFVFGDCLNLDSYLKSGTKIPVDIDILFTDTVHFYEQVSAEFAVYEPLLSDEALVVIDDIHLNDKGKFFSSAPYEKYDLTGICHISGFGAIHYKRPPEERKRTAQERIQLALIRSAQIWEKRFTKLNNNPQKLSQRINQIRKENLIGFIKKILGR